MERSIPTKQAIKDAIEELLTSDKSTTLHYLIDDKDQWRREVDNKFVRLLEKKRQKKEQLLQYKNQFKDDREFHKRNAIPELSFLFKLKSKM